MSIHNIQKSYGIHHVGEDKDKYTTEMLLGRFQLRPIIAQIPQIHIKKDILNISMSQRRTSW